MAPLPSGPSGVFVGLANSSDTGTPFDGVTADTTPTFGFGYVDGSRNAPVQIFRDGVLVSETQTDSTGFGFYDSPTLTDGTYVFTAVDPNSSTPGNLSPAVVTIDTVAPQVTYAAYNGSQIILTFDGKLDESVVLDPSPFAVTIGGQPVFNEVTVSGNEVIIGLQSPPASGAISVQYTDPSTDDDAVAVQDLAGNDFASGPINTVVDVTGDTTPPVLQSSTVVGDTLILDYDSFLRAGARADVSSFTVTADGDRIALRTVEVVGETVVLRLARPVLESEQVELAYSPSGFGTQDQAGNAAAAILLTEVTNNTDNTAPDVTVAIADANLNLSDRVSAVSFTFTEVPTGFTASDVTAIGGAITALAVDPTNPLVYTATFTADAGFRGTGSVTVAANSYTDSAGNNGLSGSDSVTVDTIGSGGGTPTSPIATSGSDNLVGTTGADTVIGLGGNDTVAGGAGNDQLQGNQGADLLFGNQGADTIYGGQNNDTAYGGQDNDLLFGNRGADLVFGNKGDDQIFGNEDDDTLYGNEGNDALNGGMGNDMLNGGQDNDTLNGGLGDDVLTGGLGSDTFIFVPGQGNDIVTDFSFEDGDELDLQGQTYVLTTGDDGSAELVLSGGGTIVLQGVTEAQFSADFVA